MFWIRRTLVLWLCVLWAGPSCAFTFSYGSLLNVKNVQHKKGFLTLPTSKRKYNNVKILSGSLYKFLAQCQADCHYEVIDKRFEIAEYRLASSRKGMLIAQVDIQQEIRLTFLVFKNKNGFSIKSPDKVVFKDKKWEEKINRQLMQLAEKEL